MSYLRMSPRISSAVNAAACLHLAKCGNADGFGQLGDSRDCSRQTNVVFWERQHIVRHKVPCTSSASLNVLEGAAPQLTDYQSVE